MISTETAIMQAAERVETWLRDQSMEMFRSEWAGVINLRCQPEAEGHTLELQCRHEGQRGLRIHRNRAGLINMTRDLKETNDKFRKAFDLTQRELSIEKNETILAAAAGTLGLRTLVMATLQEGQNSPGWLIFNELTKHKNDAPVHVETAGRRRTITDPDLVGTFRRLLRERVMDQRVRKLISQAGITVDEINPRIHNQALRHIEGLSEGWTGEKEHLRLTLMWLLPTLTGQEKPMSREQILLASSRAMEITPEQTVHLGRAAKAARNMQTKSLEEMANKTGMACVMLSFTNVSQDDDPNTVHWLVQLTERFHMASEWHPKGLKRSVEALNEMIESCRRNPAQLKNAAGERNWKPDIFRKTLDKILDAGRP